MEYTKFKDIYTCSRTRLRRIVNQHNIESYCMGTESELCGQDSVLYPEELYINYGEGAYLGMTERSVSCCRCEHRDEMNMYPNSEFVGYTRSKEDDVYE